MGPRALELSSWSRHSVAGRTRRASGRWPADSPGWALQVQLDAEDAHSSPNPAHKRPPPKKAQCSLGPQASVARGVSSFRGLQSVLLPEGKRRPLHSSLPYGDFHHPQELSDTTMGAHP